MTNHFCVLLFFHYPCDLCHKSESTTQIKQKVFLSTSGRTPSSGRYPQQTYDAVSLLFLAVLFYFIIYVKLWFFQFLLSLTLHKS